MTPSDIEAAACGVIRRILATHTYDELLEALVRADGYAPERAAAALRHLIALREHRMAV